MFIAIDVSATITLFQKTLCSKRILSCKYCEAEKVAGELTEHELSCGNKLEKCVECQDLVALREWDGHQSRFHGTHHRRFRERSVVSTVDYSKENNGT